MAVIAYNKSSVGNTITIKSDPVIGVIALTSFVESEVGVTAGLFFIEKKFRTSVDGINYSDWQDLDINNINALSFYSNKPVVIELSYTKNQPSNTLDILDVTFTEVTSPTGFDETYFENSIFAEFFGSADLEVLKWYLNVVEKLYERGLIPNFIKRENEINGDKDYIEFWSSVAKYFAMVVIYARKYRDFDDSEVLTAEFLEQRGLKTSRENDLAELDYLLYHYYHQIFNRGTIHIVDDKVLKGHVIDGELLRLIFYKPVDEFLFNLHKVEHFGWNISNSSPLWRGLYLNESLQKVTESSERTKVSNFLNYEVSFWVKTDKPITVEVLAWDKDNNPVTLLSATTGVANNIAINNVELQRSDKPVFVRVCVFSSLRPPSATNLTNLNQGYNLIMTPDVVALEPKVYIDGVETIIPALQPVDSQKLVEIQSNGDLVLKDGTILVIGLGGAVAFRVAPLWTNYTHGVIQMYNWISIWLANNNKQYSKYGIKQYIRKFLIPYNSHAELVDTLVDDIYDGSTDEDGTTTTTKIYAWRPIHPSCEYDIDEVETEWRPEGAACIDDGNTPNLIWVGDELTAECVQI